MFKDTIRELERMLENWIGINILLRKLNCLFSLQINEKIANMLNLANMC